MPGDSFTGLITKHVKDSGYGWVIISVGPVLEIILRLQGKTDTEDY
jgi:hypothetical protein